MAIKMRIMVNRKKFQIKVRRYEKGKSKSVIQHRNKSDFLGSSELADKVEQIASEKNYIVFFANKVDGTQSYIRVRRTHTMLKAHIEGMRK